MNKVEKHAIIGGVLTIVLVVVEWFMLMNDKPEIGIPFAIAYAITIFAISRNYVVIVKCHNEGSVEEPKNAKHQEH